MLVSIGSLVKVKEKLETKKNLEHDILELLQRQRKMFEGVNEVLDPMLKGLSKKNRIVLLDLLDCWIMRRILDEIQS